MSPEVVAGIAGADPAALSPPADVSLTSPEADPDVVVAVGEPAVLAHASGGVPILPVEAGSGLRSVPRDAVGDALASVVAGNARPVESPTIEARIDGERIDRALFDVMLVTEQPAHISEFSVETPTDPIAQFRADGVLVATAAGTGGYAGRVGTPVLTPELRAAAVVPIAPFATGLDNWIVPLESDPVARLTVERDDAAVVLLADDRTTCRIPAHTPVTAAVGEAVTLLRVPEGTSPFERQRDSAPGVE